MSTKHNTLFSRVGGIYIRISCQEPANFLNISNERFDLLIESLLLFEEYPEGHFKEYASQLIYNDLNSFLVSNENIFLFTFQCQVITKIIMHNILPKSGEFDRVRGGTSLLIYCILQSFLVNLP